MLVAYLTMAIVLGAAPPNQSAPPPPWCWSLLEGLPPGPNDGGWASLSQTVAATSAADVWIAWQAGFEIHVRQKKDENWSTIPTPAGGTERRDPVLSIGQPEEPVLTWVGNERPMSRIFVARWDGTRWIRLGEGPISISKKSHHAGDQSVRVAADGTVFVAWQEQPGSRDAPRSLHAARWNGKGWELLGGAVDTVRGGPSLWLDGSERPWIAWISASTSKSAPRVRVARWTGKAWKRVLDHPATRGMSASSPKLAGSGEGPMLFWSEATRDFKSETVKVMGWKATGFRPLPSPTDVQGGDRPIGFAVASTKDNGVALVSAVRDASHVARLFGQQLESDAWSPMFAGLRASSEAVDAFYPVVVEVPDGLLVAWDENSDKLDRLHVGHLTRCAPGARPAPMPRVPQLEDTWPTMVESAADRVLSTMGEDSKRRVRNAKRDQLVGFHHGWGTGIRNSFGLWRGNTRLLESCGGVETHPDTCSMKIIERVWEKLQTQDDLGAE